MGVREELGNKRILIWGYGREGQSTSHFLKRCAKPASVEVFEGKREDIDEEKYDLIFKSPGIPMDEDNPKYTSQTEIFLKEYRDQVVGITGTKGKSTTSAMLYHTLKECTDKNVILLGNIGEPCLDYFDEIDDNTIVVFEMSCHQLAHIDVSPRVAVFLNLYEEHLDYYGTMDKYFNAKSHITSYQKDGDFFFKGDNVPSISTSAEITTIKQTDVSDYQLSILGKHNNYNAEYVYRIATQIFNADRSEVKKAMSTFTGLAHRLEFVGNYDGIDYYDDSISTIPTAAIGALNSVDNAETILLGGMDRGINYDVLIEFIKAHEEYKYIMSYDSGKRIFEQVKGNANCYYEADLEKAVALAKKITSKNRACLLSPASASYGYFKNFEQRGEIFKEYVKSIV